ncbi:MAG: hypothetical protein ABFS39_08160 [Pseudomonadota bacterium]
MTERYVILEGQGEVELGGLKSQRVNPGDVVLIPPGCRSMHQQQAEQQSDLPGHL